MRKFFLALLVSIFLFSFFPSVAHAASEFTTSYNVRYQADANGVAHVNQEISLTNKLSNVYATQYSLNFQSTNIKNVQASDELGPLEVDTEVVEGSTLITLKFNQQVVGKDKTLTFNLSYDAFDLVNRTGQVWEVTVPRLTNLSEVDQYKLQLAIPFTFGNAAYISPKPISTSQEENYHVYNFTKNQIASTGVSAAFGQFQVFNFILDYHLENDRITPVFTEIALPPDTAYQKVYLQSLEPKPRNVYVDEDGNWLATYFLSGNQQLTIEAIGKVKVFSQPQKNFPTPDQSTLEKNLQEQEYWQVNHPSIQEKASELKSIKDVYNYVVTHLNYDYERVEEGAERLGSLEALVSPEKAICMEFTDLFIALARTIGVPAREVNGFAYTTNPKLRPLSLVTDVLHSWPEYWNEERKVWTPVDPTWEKTTGGVDFFNKTDLNHFAFAIHGLDSQLPAPAGSYRDFESDTKNIQVSFGNFESLPEGDFDVQFSLPDYLFTGLKTRGKIIIDNLGPTAIYYLPAQITGENLEASLLPDQEISVIPPYGKKELVVEMKTDNWLKIGEAKIFLTIDDKEYSHSLKIRSLVWQMVLPLVGLLLIFFTAVFLLIRLTLRKRRVTKEPVTENN